MKGLIVISVILLCSCGGGGGDDEDTTEDQRPFFISCEHNGDVYNCDTVGVCMKDFNTEILAAQEEQAAAEPIESSNVEAPANDSPLGQPTLRYLAKASNGNVTLVNACSPGSTFIFSNSEVTS